MSNAAEVLAQWADPETGGRMPREVREAALEVLRENERQTQMMQRIAEDVLPNPVRYADLTPEVVRDGFIKYHMRAGAEIISLRQRAEKAEAKLADATKKHALCVSEIDYLKGKLGAAEAEVERLRAEVQRVNDKAIEEVKAEIFKRKDAEAKLAEAEVDRLRAALEVLRQVERPLDVEYTTSCGHKWTMRHTACPQCFSEMRERAKKAEASLALLDQAATDYRKARDRAEAEVERLMMDSAHREKLFAEVNRHRDLPPSMATVLEQAKDILALRSALVEEENRRVEAVALAASSWAEVERLRGVLDDALAVLEAPAMSSHSAKRELALKMRAALRGGGE